MKRLLALVLTLAVMLLPMAAMAESVTENAVVQSWSQNLMNLLKNGQKIVENYTFETPNRNPEQENPIISAVLDLVGTLGYTSSIQMVQVTDELTIQGQKALDLILGASEKGLFAASSLLGDTVVGVDKDDIVKLIQASGKLPLNEDGSLNLDLNMNLTMDNLSAAVTEMMPNCVSMAQIETWEEDSDPANTAVTVKLSGEDVAALIKALIKDLQAAKDQFEQLGLGEALNVKDEQIDDATRNMAVEMTVYTLDSDLVGMDMSIHVEKSGEESGPVDTTMALRRSTADDITTWTMDMIEDTDKEDIREICVFAFDKAFSTFVCDLSAFSGSDGNFVPKGEVTVNYSGAITETQAKGEVNVEVFVYNEEAAEMKANGAIAYSYDLTCDGQSLSGTSTVEIKQQGDVAPWVIAHGTYSSADADPAIADSENVTYPVKMSEEEQQAFLNELVQTLPGKIIPIFSLLPESIQQLAGGLMN